MMNLVDVLDQILTDAIQWIDQILTDQIHWLPM